MVLLSPTRAVATALWKNGFLFPPTATSRYPLTWNLTPSIHSQNGFLLNIVAASVFFSGSGGRHHTPPSEVSGTPYGEETQYYAVAFTTHYAGTTKLARPHNAGMMQLARTHNAGTMQLVGLHNVRTMQLARPHNVGMQPSRQLSCFDHTIPE